MIPPEEAWRRLEPYLAPLPEERLARRKALGRVLSSGLEARVDVPFADVSAMDGYAFDGRAFSAPPLPVAGTVSAGDAPGLELAPGQAVRIMTGAPVPAAADRVIPVEQTSEAPGKGPDDPPGVELHAEVVPGAHIRRQGEIIHRGSPLLAAGTLLTPGAMAQLATHGYREVPVHRAPTLALLPTGDEVVSPEAEPGPGQLRDSHSDFLIGACRSLGLEPRHLGIAPDDPEELRRRIEAGLSSDVLVLTGGVSMGEYDLVEGVLQDLGCEILFEKVAVQPAKPVVAAVHPRPGKAPGLIFGLPGNPASAMVAFWLLVRPALRRLLGSPDDLWHGALAATLAGPLPGAKDRARYLPAEVRFRDGDILAIPASTLGSHDLSAYACGTALVKVPAGSPERGPGEPCEILPLADWRGGTD